MKKLGTQTLNQIQKLITKPVNKSKSPLKTQKSTKSVLKTPKQQPQKLQQNKTISPSRMTYSPGKTRRIQCYFPLDRNNKMIERQVKIIKREIEDQQNHRIQNKTSFFLNSKNPKPPIYERAQFIIEEREMMLEEKRKQKQRLKQERQEIQFQQFIAEAVPKRLLTKQKAYELTDKLYREHYFKINRMQKQKMDRMKEQSNVFRQKPEISQTSKQIFQVLCQKNKLGNDVFNRFEQYTMEKKNKQDQMEKRYKNAYFPFKPNVNETSRHLLMQSKQSRDNLSRSKHCNSCLCIKKDKSSINLTTSPKKKSNLHERQSLRISKFQ